MDFRSVQIISLRLLRSENYAAWGTLKSLKFRQLFNHITTSFVRQNVDGIMEYYFVTSKRYMKTI